MRLKLIMNPAARSGRGRHLWRAWEERLRARGCAFDACPTRGIDEARELARSAREDETAVAVGGDGTINAVLDGVLLSGRREAGMGVLYSGTSPDFCRFHGLPASPERAVDALLDGGCRPVDAARIAYASAAGAPVVSHFGCGCNIGFGAAVAGLSNRIRRYAGDTLGTLLAVLVALFRVAPADLSVQTDERLRRHGRARHVAVLKNPWIASGLRLNVDLKPADGCLCAVVVEGRSLGGLLALLPGFYTGKAVHARGVTVTTCRTVSVHGVRPDPIEFDGDPRGSLPVRIEILPGGLRLMGAGYERV